MIYPALVIVAYNRPNSLGRLLSSLQNAYYNSKDINLIISIDKSNNPDIYKIADDFNWLHGSKEVIKRPKRLGLRNHILSCGSLTKEFKSIIILEDDLFVSPFFYEFSMKAFECYSCDQNISGISLFSHCFNEALRIPFLPFVDGSDVFFLQIASSWGQIFWEEPWNDFLLWYKKKPDLKKIRCIPPKIVRWPDSSWKKYYIAYLILENKYFVYPRVSLTTNFSDTGGQHYKNRTALNQVPLLFGSKKWNFIPFHESFSKYDAYCELLSDSIKKFNSNFNNYDFEVDLYGNKLIEDITKPYIITSKKCDKPVYSFGLDFKTLELNIISNNYGDFFSFSPITKIHDSRVEKIFRKVKFFNFFYRETSIFMYILLILKKLLSYLSVPDTTVRLK